MNTEDYLQSMDKLFQLSQSWNRREGKFNLIERPKPIVEIIESSIPDHKIIQDNEPSIIIKEGINLVTSNERSIESPKTVEKPLVKKLIAEEKNLLEKEPKQATKAEAPILKKVEFHDFNSWLNSMANKPKSLGNKTTLDNTPFKKQKTIKSNPDSIHEIDASATSETLANLLVIQGYKSEAISMYEKLSTRFPEKKDTFADLIRKLKI